MEVEESKSDVQVKWHCCAIFEERPKRKQSFCPKIWFKHKYLGCRLAPINRDFLGVIKINCVSINRWLSRQRVSPLLKVLCDNLREIIAILGPIRVDSDEGANGLKVQIISFWTLFSHTTSMSLNVICCCKFALYCDVPNFHSACLED